MGLHHAIRMLCNTYIIHQNSRHLHIPGVQRPCGGHPLHLGNDNSTRCLCSHGQVQRLAGHAFLLVCQISVLIRGGGPQKGHCQLGQCIKQILFSKEVGNVCDNLFPFLFCLFIDHGPVVSRVHKRAQSHLCQKTRKAPSHLPPNLPHHSQGNVVCQNLVVHDLFCHLKGTSHMAVYAA